MTDVPTDLNLHIPLPGDRYRHYKGDFYTVITVGRLSEKRDEIYVAYKSEKYGTVWMRPLGMWLEFVHWPDGSYLPRFMQWVEGITDDLGT